LVKDHRGPLGLAPGVKPAGVQRHRVANDAC
jgi:hypothetical protein